MAKLSLLFPLTAVLILASFSAHLTTVARPLTATNGPSSGSLRPPHRTADAPSLFDDQDEFAFPPNSRLRPAAEICLSKLSEECEKQLYRGIFRDQVASVSEKCCGQVVAMGRSCHRVVLRASISKPELMLTEKMTIEKMDAEVWSRCAFISDEVV